ncbi:T2D23.8 protein, related [Neospora caninum Liverpool]|uniref:T2D23.8 protein, related n=1 Tax=Neospora caninum (strain Liverpool) TaxID=572307 RepID=F0VNP6_NEOCL|nr:T2D23.8 protein, related [Neospora caninum Liverpool]CBZ55342.1 T2D23.8 protein, related [Neospora caninum Liverpool]CEL70077.1 TPA: T2D23.8 protein, related [Neospora caninum Liverpool]|eukprot:XP_003885370.1 T2D23.8 protein, related [Neospora caninum Liverpool]
MAAGVAKGAQAASQGKKRGREDERNGEPSKLKDPSKKKKTPSAASVSSVSSSLTASSSSATKPGRLPPSPSASSSASAASREKTAAHGARDRNLAPKKKQKTDGTAPEETEEKIPGCSVSPSLLKKALAGLTAYVMKKAGERGTQDLLEEKGAATVSLMLALKNIPQSFRKHPVQIVLPHPLFDVSKGEGECCLFVKDPQRKWKDLIAPEKLSGLTRVLGIEKLKKKFPTFKDKRMLCASHDVFLCDRKIADKLTPVLGKTFIQAKKLPLPVKLSSTNVRPALEEALKSTYFFLPRGPCVAIKIGRANMPAHHLLANAKKALEAAFAFFANDAKFRNTIHAVSVQATDAPALPIYSDASYTEAARHYVSAPPPAAPEKEKAREPAEARALDSRGKKAPKAGALKRKEGGSSKPGSGSADGREGKERQAKAERPIMRLDAASKKRKGEDALGAAALAKPALQAKKKMKTKAK